MKYSLCFVALGGLVSGLACHLGHWWHLLHWFAANCFVIAAGYAGLGPRVFGKGADGRIPAWSRIFHFPYRLYSTGVWLLVRCLSRENATDRAADDLLLGRRLSAGEVPPGLSNYVDLTSELEDPAEARTSEGYLCLPILDAGAPSAAALQSALERLKPGPTFVHCAQGHGRTGLFALAWLAHRRRIQTFEEGLALLKAARPGLRLNRSQEEFVREYLARELRQ